MNTNENGNGESVWDSCDFSGSPRRAVDRVAEAIKEFLDSRNWSDSDSEAEPAYYPFRIGEAINSMQEDEIKKLNSLTSCDWRFEVYRAACRAHMIWWSVVKDKNGVTSLSRCADDLDRLISALAELAASGLDRDEWNPGSSRMIRMDDNTLCVGENRVEINNENHSLLLKWLLSAEGKQGLSAQQYADSCGVSKQTVYNHIREINDAIGHYKFGQSSLKIAKNRGRYFLVFSTPIYRAGEQVDSIDSWAGEYYVD